MTTSDRPTTGHAIGRLLRLYRRHLVLQTGIPLALGAGCVAAISWRLWLLGVRPTSIGGIGLAALAALGWWQRRALRRMWAARVHTPLALDRALGLEARLLTAAEFAGRPQPPLLYARLMEDPALVRPLSSMRLAPLADRRTIALAAALLLLLLWPWRAPLLQQLAKQPMPSPTPPPEMPPPPPPTAPGTPPNGGVGVGSPEAEGRRTSASGQSQQQQSSGGSGEPSQSSQQSQQQKGGGRSGGSADRGQSESGRADSKSGRQEQASSDAQQRQAQAGGQESGKSQQKQADKTGRQGDAPSQQGAGQAGSGKTAGAGQEKLGQRAAQTQPAPPAAPTLGGAGGAGSQQLSAAQPRPDAGRGQQEALKADIQQTLQQLSAELKQIQEELQQQRADQPTPAPGTSTDPELFEDASKLDAAAGGPLPIQLEVDTQPASKTRRGSGVGSPSAEAEDAPFQVQPESAQLAESGAEAAAGRRQAIPPEYRPVFEQLSRTEQAPTP